MQRGVLIRGEGVAASCCTRLLDQAGVPFVRESGFRPRLPAIMLGETAQKLLSDVFDRTDLFAGLPRIKKRVVAWKPNSEPLALPHSAVIVSEQALLNTIQHAPVRPLDEPVGALEWTILASRPLPESATEYPFGFRMASASPVKFKAECDVDTCWIESLERGWLFLLPSVEGGWLLSVGGSAESLLADSRLIAGQIADVAEAGGSFPCHPRITEPLGSPGWLACGTAAMGFDPLCGDGTGHATREAILASAVVRAVLDGGDVNAAVAHYRSRLLAGFHRHLQVCQEFYGSGPSGPWWEEQQDGIRRGLLWCQPRLEGAPAFRYRLNGFSLEAIE
jgi:hypothetical protein